MYIEDLDPIAVPDGIELPSRSDGHMYKRMNGQWILQLGSSSSRDSSASPHRGQIKPLERIRSSLPDVDNLNVNSFSNMSAEEINAYVQQEEQAAQIEDTFVLSNAQSSERRFANKVEREKRNAAINRILALRSKRLETRNALDQTINAVRTQYGTSNTPAEGSSYVPQQVQMMQIPQLPNPFPPSLLSSFQIPMQTLQNSQMFNEFLAQQGQQTADANFNIIPPSFNPYLSQTPFQFQPTQPPFSH